MGNKIVQEEKRMEYARWIQNVRELNKFSKKEFSEKVYHFEWRSVEGKLEEVCVPYHRNSVRNWENGENLPADIETFVAFALLEYSGNTERQAYSLEERNTRFQHVQKRLLRYFGRALYCRNLNDALLIQAARGIYALQELPKVRKEMKVILDRVGLTKDLKETYSQKLMTENMETAFKHVNSQEEFKKLVDVHKIYLYLGGRTLGERMKKMYETSKDYSPGLNLKQAVNIYAPKYRDSYSRIFFSDFSVSRHWILDFCIHMHFSREDIAKILDNANMMDLSEDVRHPEYYIREEGKEKVGTVKWYIRKAEQEPKFYGVRYREAKDLSVQMKLAFCTLLACYIYNLDSLEDVLPVDYMLEFFLQSPEGRSILDKMRKTGRRSPAEAEENPEKVFGSYAGDFDVMMENLRSHFETDKEEEYYKKYCSEFKAYYNLPKEKTEKKFQSDMAERMHLFATLSYSIFTGKIYQASLTQKDMEILKEELTVDSEMKSVYLFLNFLWVMFLDLGKIKEDEQGRIYMKKNDKKTRALDMEGILEDISASWMLSESLCTK